MVGKYNVRNHVILWFLEFKPIQDEISKAANVHPQTVAGNLQQAGTSLGSTRSAQTPK